MFRHKKNTTVRYDTIEVETGLYTREGPET